MAAGRIYVANWQNCSNIGSCTAINDGIWRSTILHFKGQMILKSLQGTDGTKLRCLLLERLKCIAGDFVLECVACNDFQPGPYWTTTLAASYILVDGSLNYVVSKSDCSVLNTLMISEEWIRRNVGEWGHCLEVLRKTKLKFSQDKLCSLRDSIQTPSEHSTENLPLLRPCSMLFFKNIVSQIFYS